MPKTAIPAFQTEPLVMHPALRVWPGEYDYTNIGGAGEITKFGVHIELLFKAAKSSLHHWHQAEDKIVYMPSSEFVLVEDDNTVLREGDTRLLASKTSQKPSFGKQEWGSDASYLTVGTHNKQDVIHYSDHDLITHKEGKNRSYTHSEGSPFEKRNFK